MRCFKFDAIKLTLMLCIACIPLQSAFGNAVDLYNLKSIEDVRSAPFYALSPEDSQTLRNKVHQEIVTAISRLNERRSMEAAQDIYSDWWCYDNEVLFETRIALELATVYKTSSSFDTARSQLFEIVAHQKEKMPDTTFELHDNSPEAVSRYVNSMVAIDQYWDGVVINEFENLKKLRSNFQPDVEVLRQLVAREQCDSYSVVAKKFNTLLEEVGLLDPQKYGAMVTRQLMLIALHFDYYLDTQRLVLKHFLGLVESGQFSERAVATLYDRVSLNVDGYQKYGTQVTCTSQGYMPLKLESPNDLTEIRANAGMLPFDQYRKLIPGCGNQPLGGGVKFE